MSKCYCIIPLVDVTQRMINLSTEDSTETLRLSNDSNDTVFKFDNDDILAKETFIDYPWLCETDMKNFLETDLNWTPTE